MYEAGHRQPFVLTLTALIAATGNKLNLSVGKHLRGVQRLTGPVGVRLCQRRSEVLEIAGRDGVQVLGVFGSVARGEDRPDSDIDLLVKLPDRMGLFVVARVQNELEEVLGAPVDLIPESGLKAGACSAVQAGLVRLRRSRTISGLLTSTRPSPRSGPIWPAGICPTDWCLTPFKFGSWRLARLSRRSCRRC